MKEKLLYMLWAGLYILCAALGFIPEPEKPLSTAMTLLSIAFFIPGFLLLYRGHKKTVGIISLISLGLTLLCLLLNVWSVGMTANDGTFVYTVLGLVSAPMLCSQVWILSLFLWACLLMGSLMKLPRLPK